MLLNHSILNSKKCSLLNYFFLFAIKVYTLQITKMTAKSNTILTCFLKNTHFLNIIICWWILLLQNSSFATEFFKCLKCTFKYHKWNVFVKDKDSIHNSADYNLCFCTNYSILSFKSYQVKKEHDDISTDNRTLYFANKCKYYYIQNRFLLLFIYNSLKCDF